MSKSPKHKPEKKQSFTPWQNRIVGYTEEPPDQLLASPWNYRIHPQFQQESLSGILKEIGIIQNIVVNQTTQHVIDGHLRIALAMREKQSTVPVTWVTLSEDEERLALLTLDPITSLATVDRDMLKGLLEEVNSGDAAVQAMLADLAQREGIVPPSVEFPEYDESAEKDVKYVECPECGHKFPA